MTIRPYLLSLLILGGCFALHAQTEEADSLIIPGYEQLDELVIEGEKPVMHTDGAKLTYNVEEDPGADSSNALDMLKKVPMVSVDGDGNVLLNGSSAFKFQLNGMENPMLKQYAGQILQGMPASNIVKIEVITEPGAKEDAEGVAGIINIITERTRSRDGYSGNVSLQAGNRNLTPSLYAILKKNRVTLSANVNYQWGFGKMKGQQESLAEYLDGSNGKMRTLVGQSSTHQYAGGNLNLSWEPNDNNLFTMGANLFYIDANLPDLYGSTSYSIGDGSPEWSFSQKGFGGMKILNLSVNASYRHNFAPTGNYLVLSYLYNFGKNNLGITRDYTDLVNYSVPFEREDQRSITFNRGHTVQADYANDFSSEHHLLEVGAKGIFRRNSALSLYQYGTPAGPLFSLPGLDSDIAQPQDIYAGYASYTGSFDKFGVTGGLRYEHTRMGITDKNDPSKNFTNRLSDIVPNAALTWNFTPATNLRLSYQMRISRPSIDQVNPFQLSFTPYEVREGNPDLTSERSHIVNLKLSSFGRVLGGSIGLEYNLADNAITSYTFLRQNADLTTIVTSYANIGKRQDVALTGFATWNIISRMTLTLNGRLAYNSLRAPSEGYSNHGWSGSIGGFWNYTVADVYKFSAYGTWNSRSLTVQGFSSGFYYYGLSAARDFLADRSLTLSLSANNFLQSRMNFKGYTATPGVIYHNTGSTLSAWNVAVSLTWKFGSLNAQVKKTGVEVKNDDINSSSNKSSATGI